MCAIAKLRFRTKDTLNGTTTFTKGSECWLLSVFQLVTMLLLNCSFPQFFYEYFRTNIGHFQRDIIPM